jgi:hypothetical protein
MYAVCIFVPLAGWLVVHVLLYYPLHIARRLNESTLFNAIHYL